MRLFGCAAVYLRPLQVANGSSSRPKCPHGRPRSDKGPTGRRTTSVVSGVGSPLFVWGKPNAMPAPGRNPAEKGQAGPLAPT